ncbi:MAG: AsmA family protein [Deltaproteobacteria bacterium]|nr:AsmA family protein [Deltaproteobacteria bacterium]
MSKKLKIALLAAGGLVALLVLLMTAILLFVDVNAYKPRLEAAASDALGMEVRVGGRLGIGFFPGFHVALDNVRIRNRGTDLVSAAKAAVGIELLPLLHKEVRIGRIGLASPRIFIERDRGGRFNFEKAEEKEKKPGEEAEGMLPSLDVGKVSLSDGSLLYMDKKTGGGIEAGGFDLDVSRLRLPGGKSSDLLKNLSFSAKFACKEFRTKDLDVSDLNLSVVGKDGVLDVKPVTMRIFGGQGSGSIRADLSGPVPIYHVHYSLPKFRFEEFLKSLSPKKTAEGPMDFSANLSMRGKTAKEMTRTADGEVSLRGENLTFDGIDLDRVLSRYESSQSFNLVDVGAFFFAGPIGPALTKGYGFASIFQRTGGRSRIRKLVSDWKVERGVAHAKDVAMATHENRIALKGRLDFANERFDDVTVALIDGKGCARVRQKIRGSFGKPKVEEVSVLRSLAGPALKLFRQTRDLFPGGQCEPFYAGSVAPPK